MTQSDQQGEVIARAAAYAAPLFRLFGWTWRDRVCESYIPDEDAIRKTLAGLWADAVEERTTVSSGRLAAEYINDDTVELRLDVLLGSQCSGPDLPPYLGGEV